MLTGEGFLQPRHGRGVQVIYRQEQDFSKLPDVIRKQFYGVEPYDHVTYYGLIEAAYIIEDAEEE